MLLLEKLRVRREITDARREGDRCRDARSWAEAAAWYRKHLDRHPGDFGVWVQTGNCLKEAQSFEQSLAAYRRAIALDDSNADVFLQLGHLQKLMGKRDEAIEHYHMSLARQPHNNPASGELSSLGVVATAPIDIGPGPSAIGNQRPINVGRGLRAIENQLHRLIEAWAEPTVTNLATPSSRPVLSGPPTPQFSSIPPPSPVVAARESRPSIFVVVSSTGSFALKVPSFLDRLCRAFVEQGESVRFVWWNTDVFQLPTRDALKHAGLSAGLGERAASYPTHGQPKVIIDPSSCSRDDWLLVPEALCVAPGKCDLIALDMIMGAKRLGLRTAFILHGAEPLRLKGHVGRDADTHEQYMQSLLLSDAIMPVSTLASDDLTAFLVQHQKADSVPRIEMISPPTEIPGDDAANRWSDYVRRIRGLLTDAADRSRHLSALYYWVDPVAPSGTAGAVFAHRLAHALSDRGIALIPVVWDAERKQLIAAKGKALSDWAHVDGQGMSSDWIEPGQAAAPRWLFHADGVRVDLLAEVAAFARTRRLRTAAILHEALHHAGEEHSATSSAHDRALLEALAGIDKVLAVSERRIGEFHRFLLSLRGRVHSVEHRFKAIGSPNEIPEQRRRLAPRRPTPGSVRIVVVVPHDRVTDLAILLDAASEAAGRSDNRLSFTLIGSPSSLSVSQGEILEGLEAKVRSIANARWEKEAGTERLNQLFEESDFAVFAGLEGENAQPVLEGLWRGLPWLVHGGKAISPITPGSGLAFADMRNCSALSEAILKLAEQDWRRCLALEAIGRPVRSWADYARDIAIELAADRLTDALYRVEAEVGEDVYATLINLRRRPKLSLCISTYNRAGWVEVNLRNIFAHMDKPRDDLEVLVVDNASVDHTPEAVKPYLARPDFRYVRNSKNVGMLGNLAVTAQRAKGEYIWILGDDDLTRPGAIERVLLVIDQHPGIGLIYLNYGYTTETNPGNVTDLAAFLASYNTLEPAGPDEFAPVNRLAAKSENFFTAIYSHVYRRDHAMKAYCQDTSGRIFSTMLSCVPTAYYVLNYMADEPAYWIGEPLLVVNSNVSWQEYAALLDLEQLPRAWDLAERMGTDPGEVDRRRANRLWLVEMMWKEIFQNDRAGNSEYFSAPRVLMRLKHLKELDKHIPEFMSIYERARNAGHPAAIMPTGELFSAFGSLLCSLTGPSVSST